MLFNSLQFLFFFIIVTSLYFALSHKWRWLLLLLSSCYFYMAFIPIYIVILGFTIIVDYFAGILIEKSKGQTRRLFLICSLIANIGVLAIFKYYNFINTNMAFFLQGFCLSDPLPYLSIILPIGLSFHTFKAMSYTIEVFRGNQKAEHHFGIYALYEMFYPQLVSGPIERPQNLLHQFREKHYLDYDRVVDGLKLMAWGLFQKVVIADRLAVVVDHVYDNPQMGNGLSFAVATLFFGFQIFCDFSGYSDMAIGAGRVMGFKLMENFNRPYLARSIPEFWRCWHISLSTWFKDYLYIPLGGNRVAMPRLYMNLFVVFMVSGLWHGSNWTFVIWGALHGFYYVFALMTKDLRSRIRNKLRVPEFPLLQTLTTFTLVSVAWVFFRAGSLDVALYMIKRMITDIPMISSLSLQQLSAQLNLGVPEQELIMCFMVILILNTIHILQKRVNLSLFVKQRSPLQRWVIYYGAIFSIILLGVFENRQFIYFQF